MNALDIPNAIVALPPAIALLYSACACLLFNIILPIVAAALIATCATPNAFAASYAADRYNSLKAA